MLVILLNLNSSYSRSIRDGVISWDEFMQGRIQEVTSKYDSSENMDKSDRLKKDVRVSERYIPRVINWVRNIFVDYEVFGSGKLVFLGGAAKKAYQVAKLLSTSYGISPSNVVYIDMPRDVIGNSSGYLDQLMRQEGIYDASAVTFVDVCIDWVQENDPILRLSEIIKAVSPKIMLSYATLVNHGLFREDPVKEKELFGVYKEYGGEGLMSFLEESPRYRASVGLVLEGDRIVSEDEFKSEFHQDLYKLRLDILYSVLAGEFRLPVPSFLENENGPWDDFTLSILSDAQGPISLDELERLVGVVEEEDINWFSDAVKFSLEHLLNEGRVIEEDGYYRINEG